MWTNDLAPSWLPAPMKTILRMRFPAPARPPARQKPKRASIWNMTASEASKKKSPGTKCA